MAPEDPETGAALVLHGSEPHLAPPVESPRFGERRELADELELDRERGVRLLLEEEAVAFRARQPLGVGPAGSRPGRSGSRFRKDGFTGRPGGVGNGSGRRGRGYAVADGSVKGLGEDVGGTGLAVAAGLAVAMAIGLTLAIGLGIPIGIALSGSAVGATSEVTGGLAASPGAGGAPPDSRARQ